VREIMNIEMQKANLLADNIHEFIKFVEKNHEPENRFILNKDKSYQVKLYIEEYKFQLLADELKRINRFAWDEKYTYWLVNQFMTGINIIDEFVKNNDEDLFIFSARLYTIKNLCWSFSEVQV
jgi:REP element-mobilizing transposase RayT